MSSILPVQSIRYGSNKTAVSKDYPSYVKNRYQDSGDYFFHLFKDKISSESLALITQFLFTIQLPSYRKIINMVSSPLSPMHFLSKVVALRFTIGYTGPMAESFMNSCTLRGEGPKEDHPAAVVLYGLITVSGHRKSDHILILNLTRLAVLSVIAIITISY